MSNKASLLSRLIALIIDSIILGVVAGILRAVTGSQELSGLVAFLIGVVYQGFFLTNNNGQTPGKMLLGIRVVKTGGGKLSWFDAFLRYVGYYINTFVIFIGWLWAIIDSKNQGWHDKIAGTVVVKA